MMRLLPSLCVLSLAACAGSEPVPSGAEELSLGDPTGPPTLRVLPSIAHRSSGQTDRTLQGMLVARQGFDARLPQTPADQSYANLQRWVDTDVVAWVGSRSENMDSASYEFGLPSDGSDGERIVGFAVIGLLHEDTARELSTIPAPSELDSEPEIAVMYREVIAAHARPFLSAALVRFRDCANLAHGGPEDMRHWAGFCDARFQRLKVELDDYMRSISGQPGSTSETGSAASGESTVTVIVESP